MSQRSTHLQTPSRSQNTANRNRRQTLGPVGAMSSSRARGRKSLAPESSTTKASDAALPSSAARRKPRKSMIPRIGGGRENQVPPSPARSVASTTAASSRRQSVGSTAASTSTASRRRQSLVPHAYTNPTLRDPRNLSDKAWQQACAKKVGQFLQQGGYDHPLTPKTLRSPSAKDFGLMVTFLLRQVDPTFGQGNGMKLEDEVVLNFRALGYPFGVSKTSLVAAGSPHTWPTLLAALAWLVDQLTLLHQAEETRPFLETMDQTLQFESLQDLQHQTEQAFFGYLGECYTAFMHNDASQTEALQAALAERFAVDDAYLEQEINRIQDLNANIAVRMEDLQNASADLPHYQKKRDDYQTDMEQFRDLLRQMDEHKNALRAKIEERSTELESTNAKWERMKAHVDSLLQTIASQGMSVESLRKLQAEHKGIREATDRMSKTVHQRQNALHAVEVEVAQVMTQLDVALSEYNGKLAEVSLALVSASAYKARLDRDQLASPLPQALLGVNFEEQVEPAVQQAQENMRLHVLKAQQDYDNAIDQVQALEQQVGVAAAKLRVANEKAVKVVAVLGQERHAQSQTTAVHQREVGLLEEKAAALRDPVVLEESLAALRRQCADLEASWESSVDGRQRHVQQLATQIQQCQCLLQEHEAAQRAELQELLDYWKTKAGDLEALQGPAHWENSLHPEK